MHDDTSGTEDEVLARLAAGELTVDEAEALLGAETTAGAAPAPAPRGGSRARAVPVDLVVTLVANGASPDYAQQLVDAGLGDAFTHHEVVALGANKVPVPLLAALRDAGLATVPVHEVVALALNGADAEFVREVDAGTGPPVAVADMLAMLASGVRPSQMSGLYDATGRRFGVAELIGLAVNGVGADNLPADPDPLTAPSAALIAAAAARLRTGSDAAR